MWCTASLLTLTQVHIDEHMVLLDLVMQKHPNSEQAKTKQIYLFLQSEISFV